MLTKDSAAPVIHNIAQEIHWQQWKRTPFSYRAAVVSEMLKAQRSGTRLDPEGPSNQWLKGQRQQIPIGQSANNQGGFLQRVGQAIDYGKWALMGDNRAFFPPGYSLAPQAPPDAKGRRWDYPFWYNLQIPPRAYESISFDILRVVADTYDLLRIAIESCKNRIAFQDWDIVPSDPNAGKSQGNKGQVNAVPNGTQDRMKWLKSFFQYPDNDHDFGTWAREGLEDLLVIDAMTVYCKGTLSGQPHSLQWIDGATMCVKLDYWGDTPQPPETAYQQIIKGLPAIDYGADELFYLPFNRRTHKAYGYSPVEQILVTINIALRRQMYQLEWYRTGATGNYMLCAPPDWDRNQMDEFQSWYNNQFFENPAARHRATIVPYGSKPIDQHQIALKDEMDDWLASLICAAIGVDRSQLIKPMNRASAQHGGDQSAKEGIIAFSDFFKSSMNRVVRNTFGWEDVEFTWADEENMFNQEKSKSYETYCNIGAITINEIRDDLGLEALPGGDQCALGANFTLVQLDEVNKLSDQNAKEDELHQAQVEGAKNPAGPGGPKKPMGGGANGKGSSGGTGAKGGNPKGSKPSGGGSAARKVSYCLDYDEEPEPGEMLRFVEKSYENTRPIGHEVDDHNSEGGRALLAIAHGANMAEKGFDVTPGASAGPQPYGGNKRSRTMMHARGTKLHNKSVKKKITRTATAGARIADEERVGKLKAAIHKILVERAAAVADGVISHRHRLAHNSRAGANPMTSASSEGQAKVREDSRGFESPGGSFLAQKTASPFHEGGWGDPSLMTPTHQIKSLVAHLLWQEDDRGHGWEVLPPEVGPILAAEAQDVAVEVIASAGIIVDQDQWNAVDDEVADLALDRAGELVGMKWDKDEEKWVENPNAEWRIDEDVRDEISKLVSSAEQEGWSNKDLKNAIVESNLFSEDRADLIARTELKYIDGMGAAAVAERTGATQKKWMLSSLHDDEDECDDNAEADWIGVDDDFPNGEDTVPAHPRCRCVVTYGWEDSSG